jgi:hypothetical protein
MSEAKRKITPEQEAKLCLALTTMLKATEAKLATMKASLALMENKPVEEALAHLDEAVEAMHRGIEEAKVFRNVLRDDRPRHVLNKVRTEMRLFGDERRIPRHERDPAKLLAEMVRGIEQRREREDLAATEGTSG